MICNQQVIGMGEFVQRLEAQGIEVRANIAANSARNSCRAMGRSRAT
jgi:hypothetical protein